MSVGFWLVVFMVNFATSVVAVSLGIHIGRRLATRDLTRTNRLPYTKRRKITLEDDTKKWGYDCPYCEVGYETAPKHRNGRLHYTCKFCEGKWSTLAMNATDEAVDNLLRPISGPATREEEPTP